MDDQFETHVRPQENNNKTDILWAEVTNAQGRGLRASGVPNVSVLHYTAEDLTAAQHTFDLKCGVPKRSSTWTMCRVASQRERGPARSPST